MQTSLHVSKPTAYTRSSRQVRALLKIALIMKQGNVFHLNRYMYTRKMCYNKHPNSLFVFIARRCGRCIKFAIRNLYLEQSRYGLFCFWSNFFFQLQSSESTVNTCTLYSLHNLLIVYL